MRTTISIDDELFRTYKARAAQRGTTLSAEIEEALRADAAARDPDTDEQPFVLVEGTGRARPGVDITSNAALDELGL